MLNRHLGAKETRKEAGFTLVELLVVIVIIGLLTAIAIPVYMNQRQKANDATLISDLRSAANAIVSSDLHPDEFAALHNNRIAVNAWGEDSVHNMPNARDWNEVVPDVDPIAVSAGTHLAINIVWEERSGWLVHQQGDFCIRGVHPNSSWDYIPGSGAGSEFYDHYLYYDPAQGGIRTADELVEAYEEDPASISCTGAIYAYTQD